MNLETLIELCQKFRDLGDSVGSQLADVIEDPSITSIHDQNGHALRIADREFLEAVALVAKDDEDEELLEDIASLREAIEDASTACRGCQSQPGDGATPDCPECGQDPDEGDDEIRDDARVSA